jgi:hypothetical protein
MFKRFLLLAVTAAATITTTKAQYLEPYVHSGEFGISAGIGHYFGDLNTRAAINRPKVAAGAFFRKQLNNYVGLRLAANYVQVGYSDMYSRNETQYRRNLSFNSDIWELSVVADFNFFKFQPGFEGYNYTPYVGIGVGMFAYDPYAYLNGVKYNLRDIGTEGQGSSAYPDRKPYGTTALSIPLSFGFKYAFNEKLNFFTELTYRFTNTDYLDDVSLTYAPDAFSLNPNGTPSVGMLLQDRSYETGAPIGVKGRQRGNSTQKDGFVTMQFGLSFNLSSYRCPTN